MTALAFVAGCAAEGEPSEEVEAGTEAALTGGSAAAVDRTMCFGGRTLGDPYSVGGIREIDTLCRKLPGLIRDPAGARDAAYPFFQWDSKLDHELDVLVAALDTNHDGVVTNTDAPVRLNLVGYSWGGFNALDMAEAIGKDPRFSASRRAVARFFALDAFRTDYLVWPRGEMRVPSNVASFYSFRHTKAPKDDCSYILFGMVGPFTGRDPACTGTTVCQDYDFSAAPATVDVDHCDVPGSAQPFVLDIVGGRKPSGLPPSLGVDRY